MEYRRAHRSFVFCDCCTKKSEAVAQEFDLNFLCAGTCIAPGQDCKKPEVVAQGPDPNFLCAGTCIAPGPDCTNLGIKDNLCGSCTKISGGFKLENTAGLRFEGFSFDDNQNGAGSIQARNVCLLARYGNKGSYGSQGDFLSL